MEMTSDSPPSLTPPPDPAYATPKSTRRSRRASLARRIRQLGRDTALTRLTGREREVLGLMAEGRSNGAIAQQLVVSADAVEKHISNIFAKLDIHADGDSHRRVLAVLTYLRHGEP